MHGQLTEPFIFGSPSFFYVNTLNFCLIVCVCNIGTFGLKEKIVETWGFLLTVPDIAVNFWPGNTKN